PPVRTSRPRVVSTVEAGMALLSVGRLAEAVRVFADVVREDATNVPALLGAAHCALGLDERDGARALLLRIVELDPTNEPARAALAILDQPPTPAPPADPEPAYAAARIPAATRITADGPRVTPPRAEAAATRIPADGPRVTPPRAEAAATRIPADGPRVPEPRASEPGHPRPDPSPRSDTKGRTPRTPRSPRSDP